MLLTWIIQVAVTLEMTHCKLQYVRLFQFRVLRLSVAVLGILMLRRLQNKGLEYGQALVDAGTSTLLHEWFIGSFANVLR